MGITRACVWLALSSLTAAEAQTAATTTQTSAASATFAYVSEDGCVQNEVTVFTYLTTVVSAKPPNPTAAVTYSRYRYDFCEGTDLGADLGTSAARPIFSGDLNSAALNATINVHTLQGSAVTISVVLIWEGRGSIARHASQPQNTNVGGPRVIRSESLNRNAVVSGTIDGQDVSEGMVSASLHATRKTISR